MPDKTATEQAEQKVVLDSPEKAKASPSKPRKKKKRVVRRSLLDRLVIGLVQLAVLVYVGFVAALVLMEERLVYPAAYFQGPDRSAATNASGVETVTFSSTNDVVISARLLERPSASRYVLYFHGNGVKAKWLDGWLTQLSASLDATVLAAEYRGFDDDVTPTEKGVLEDCFAARDWMCDRYHLTAQDLILYGRSLGGGCAVAVASRGGAKALILERTFDRLSDVAAAKYPFVPIDYLIKNRYDSLAKLSVYQGPLLQVHGIPDELIPIQNAQRLYASSSAKPKKMIEVEGLNHVDPLPPEVVRAVAQWIDQFVPDQASGATGEADLK